MKRRLALLLALVMVFGMAACSKPEPESTEPTVPPTQAPTEPVRKTIHILLPESLEAQSMELANLVDGFVIVKTA